MAADAFALTMVAVLQAALPQAQAAGLLSVVVDGQTVTYQSFEMMQKAYDYWTSRVARANGSRPRCAQINLGGYR